MHSSLIFDPPFPTNFDYPTKTPEFSTIVHTPVSKRGEIRTSLAPYPIWNIEYSLEWARGGEQVPSSVYQYMLGFYIAMGGQFSDFLYQDPNDFSVTKVQFATGDGTTTLFQLTRPIGIGTDIVQNLLGPPIIYEGQSGVTLVTNYTVEANGVINFTTPPTAGTDLFWSGLYYYRVRFAEDQLPFDQMMQQIWESKSIKLRSVIL